jgi:hypothetical protein
MNKGIILTDEFLDATDVMPVEGDATDYTSPAVYDIPREVKISTNAGGESVIRFVYPDREEATEIETLLDEQSDVFIKRGRYSGKLMTLRLPTRGGAVPAVAERLRLIAPHQKRKNQELNFLLLSNILRKKQDELQLV